MTARNLNTFFFRRKQNKYILMACFVVVVIAINASPKQTSWNFFLLASFFPRRFYSNKKKTFTIWNIAQKYTNFMPHFGKTKKFINVNLLVLFPIGLTPAVPFPFVTILFPHLAINRTKAANNSNPLNPIILKLI